MAKAKTPAKAAAKIKTTADFDKLHNKSVKIPAQIREGLKKLGPRGWEYWGAFMSANGIAPNVASVYTEMFEKFTVDIPRDRKRIICGSERLANEFRAKV